MKITEFVHNLPRDWQSLCGFLAARPWVKLGDGLDGPSRALLADLYLHLGRQTWVGAMVREQLGGDLNSISSQGALGHPDRPQAGALPGHPGWSYFFHGRGCALEHGDGTYIDVNFYDGRSDRIDRYFYAHYLESLPQPNLAQQMLKRSVPFGEAWMADLRLLSHAGLITHEHAFSLTLAGVKYGRQLARLVSESYTGAAAVACAALFGRFEPPPDLPDAYRDTIGELLRESRWAQQGQRSLHLLEAYRDQRDATEQSHTLLALAAEDWEAAKGLVQQLLREGDLDGPVSLCLEILEAQGAFGWEEELLGVMQRARGKQEPQPHIRITAAKLLLSHWHPDELEKEHVRCIVQALRRAAGADGAAAAGLLYLVDPKPALELLRNALGDGIPICRTEAAVALALLARGDNDAAQLLATTATPEANYARAVAAGVTIAPVKPAGQVVEHGGRQITLYSADQVMDAHLPGWIHQVFEGMQQSYVPLLQRWRPEIAEALHAS